jgi:hypothetical protein
MIASAVTDQFRHLSKPDARFPLTLALYLGERELLPELRDRPKRLGFVSALGPILPLPEGAGRDEGESGQAHFAGLDVSRLLCLCSRPRVPRLSTIRHWIGLGKLIRTLVVLLATLAAGSRAEEFQFRSQWDEGLLDVELRDVSIEKAPLHLAWQEMATKYLLRSVMYYDVRSDADSATFSFKKDKATGRELVEAFLGAYPAYTYTQDKDTGVIWFHRKTVKYSEILKQRIAIAQPQWQISMYRSVLELLRGLLAPSISSELPFATSLGSSETFNYPVDLPAGVYPARDIVNFCCLANPTKTFGFSPLRTGGLNLAPINLPYGNPLVPPRAAAVSFWEKEIGRSTNGIPSPDEIGLALADPSPRKRWAARMYLQAAPVSYRRGDLINQSDDPRKVVWAALALRCLELPSGQQPYLSRPFMGRVMQIFTNDLAHLDPGLALLTAMELAREKDDASLMDCVAGHKFTSAEMEVIKPDLYRIARRSQLVRDKLRKMKFDVPELSPAGLDYLDGGNAFTLAPQAKTTNSSVPELSPATLAGLEQTNPLTVLPPRRIGETRLPADASPTHAQPPRPAVSAPHTVDRGQETAVAALPSGYEMAGSLTQTVVERNGTRKESTNQFKVFVRDGGWLIQVIEWTRNGNAFQWEVGSTNGLEIFALGVYLDAPPKQVSTNAPGPLNEPPPARAKSPPFDTATITPSNMPVGENDAWVVGHLWLMFASQNYWGGLKTGRLRPIYDWQASVPMDPNMKVPAKWELLSGPGSLPNKVMYLGRWEETNGFYAVTRTNSVGGTLIPGGFVFEEQKAVALEGMVLRKRVEVEVTAVQPACSRASLIPVPVGRTIVIDRRLALPGPQQQLKIKGYDNPVRGRWPTLEEAMKALDNPKPNPFRPSQPIEFL